MADGARGLAIVAMTDARTGTALPNVGACASRAQIAAYRVAEFVTLARDGSPVGWPLTPRG